MIQSIFMSMIGILCVASSLCWFSQNNGAAGVAFLAWAIGYGALAFLFAS
jgi:hypothetical protein